jgi:hypothetical protein
MSFNLPYIEAKPVNPMFVICPNVRTGEQRLMHPIPTESQELIKCMTINAFRLNTIKVR